MAPKIWKECTSLVSKLELHLGLLTGATGDIDEGTKAALTRPPLLPRGRVFSCEPCAGRHFAMQVRMRTCIQTFDCLSWGRASHHHRQETSSQYEKDGKKAMAALKSQVKVALKMSDS